MSRNINKIHILSLFLALHFGVYAQSPAGVSYQVLIRDASGALVSIRQGTEGGSSYTISVTTPLRSVPYGWHTDASEDAKFEVSSQGDTLQAGIGEGIVIPRISFGAVEGQPAGYPSGYQHCLPDGETTDIVELMSLKWPLSGYRDWGKGKIDLEGSQFEFWMGSVSGTQSWTFYFAGTYVDDGISDRGNGRCA